MKALMFDRTGLPQDVLELRDTPVPRPGPGEALVRVMLSPIIPGDALFTQGLYPQPVRPQFPGETAGNYGVGIVEEVGEGTAIPIGSYVSVTHRRLWAEYASVPEAKLIRLPEGYRAELGAEFMNLVTAWDLLEASGAVKGQWLAITGGHSTVALILTQFASALGIKVLSIVRRRHETIDLHALGAKHVIVLDEISDLRKAVLDASLGGVHSLVDCVGGPAFAELARALRLGSRAVIYGGFATEPFTLHNFDILLNLLEIRSYVYRYFFDPPAAADEARVRQILALAAQLNLVVPCAGKFRLEQFGEALNDSATGRGIGRRYFAPA